MKQQSRKILLTSALPYVSGPVHLGHSLEVIQTDIWARFQRLREHDCIYVCASDAHGTPVMLRARSAGLTPEELAEHFGRQHQRDFADLLISFDSYHTTHSRENRELVELIYERLREGGHIERRAVRQAYDAAEQMFLPDRYVRGECPVCGTPDQYGDSCEHCSATYAPSDLVNPVSVLSGTRPEERESEHLFVRLGNFTRMLSDWIRSGSVQEPVRRKLEEWFDAGLKDWDISRDAPYFGFEIPGEPGKYFYVWLDAPVGYMASFRKLATERGYDFDSYWSEDSDAELYHFIGKDIIYFHCLFWPAVLSGAGFRVPTAVHAHGFLTINGEKMSKRRNTYIEARSYLEHLDPQYLRYYYAAKLGSGVDDLDLNLDDFLQRVNADLVGKFVNIASRSAGFISKRFGGRLAARLPDPALYRQFVAAGESIANAYETREYARAMREIMSLADRANQYVDEHKPWLAARDDKELPQVQLTCTQSLNLFRVLAIFLKPVLPALATQAEAFLNGPALRWRDLEQPLLDHELRPYQPLLTRMERSQLDAMLADATRAADEAASGI